MMLPMEKEPERTAAAKARFVAPPKLEAVHYGGVSEGWSFGRPECRMGAYLVEHGQWGDDGIDKVDASKYALLVARGKERHQSASDDSGWVLALLSSVIDLDGCLRRDDANNDPGPPVGLVADAEPHEESEEDADGT